MECQCSARQYDGAVKVNSVMGTLKEQLSCFASKVSSICNFSINSVKVSVGTFYIKDRPKINLSKLQKLWERVGLSTSTFGL